MKVLQTLGRSSGSGPAHPSAFYYERTYQGIRIEGIFGDKPIKAHISHEQWLAILDGLQKAQHRLFSISANQTEKAAPQSLHSLIEERLASANFQSAISESLLGYITAILLNEGTIEFYQGKTTGDDREHRVTVRAIKDGNEDN